MISLDSATQLAQAAPNQIIRDFLEIRVKDDDGNVINDFIWSGAESITATVLDPLSGQERSETWIGAGNLVSVGPIIRSIGLTITTLNIELSGVSSRIRDLEETYITKFGTIIVYRGYLNVDTAKAVGPARCRFLGKIASIEHNISGTGGESTVNVICNNSINDLTRSSPATRSDALQLKRNSLDSFRKYVVAMAKREIFWGRKT